MLIRGTFSANPVSLGGILPKNRLKSNLGAIGRQSGFLFLGVPFVPFFCGAKCFEQHCGGAYGVADVLTGPPLFDQVATTTYRHEVIKNNQNDPLKKHQMVTRYFAAGSFWSHNSHFWDFKWFWEKAFMLIRGTSDESVMNKRSGHIVRVAVRLDL